MEWESDSPCRKLTYPGQGRRSPRRHSGWEFRDCTEVPGWGLLLTVERRTEGMWGRRLWWETPVEESQIAVKGKQYCWVMHRGWSHHYSLSLPTCQHWQLNSREAGPSNTWGTELQSRTPAREAPLCAWRTKQQRRALAREPSKRLNGRRFGDRLAKEAFWWPATRGSKKDSDRARIPAVEAVRVPAPLAPPGSPQAKQLHHLHAQPSLGQSCHGQRSLVSVCAGSLWSCPALCQPVDYVLPGSSVRGFSRQEYWSVLASTGCHVLLEHCISCCPSRQLPWVPGAARIPAIQAAAPPPHLALTGANPNLQGQPQEQSPVDDPQVEVEIKPHLKPRGSMAKKTQNLPTSCTSWRLNPHDQLARLCICGIYKRTLKTPTTENALVLMAVDIGGKNTQE